MDCFIELLLNGKQNISWIKIYRLNHILIFFSLRLILALISPILIV